MAVPSSGSLVPRPALAARLLGLLEGAALVAIVAPAGYGKSSLATLAFSSDQAPPAAWYAAQRWHAGEFVEPLVAAIRRERPGFGRLTLALAQRRPDAEGDDLTRWAQRAGATFATELSHIESRIAVVLEDAHVLADDAAFGEFLIGAIRLLPDQVRLLVICRRLPPLPLAEWIAQGRARLLDATDLRFDAGEIRLLAAHQGRTLAADEVQRLEAQFEGWPAGVVLTLGAGDRLIPSPDGALEITQALLLDANLAALEPASVAFLEETAVYETLSTRVLRHDESLRDPGAHLRSLERRGVMLSAVRPGEIYRLHPLFREALLERVRRRTGAEAVAALHRRAAGVLERAGAFPAALFHLEQAGEREALVAFLSLRAFELFGAGFGRRATQVARRLQGSDRALSARYEAMLARQYGEPSAGAHVREALATVERSDEDSRELLPLYMIATEDRLARLERVGADELAALLESARSASPLLESDAQGLAGWAAVRRHDLAEAHRAARRTNELAGHDVVRRTRAAQLEAYVSTCLGDFASADATLGACVRELEGSDHVVLLANISGWYARLALLWGDVEIARDYASQAKSLSQRLDLSADLAGIELAIAEVAGYDADVAACERAGEEARRLASAAWYATDRARTPALTALFAARAAFARGDAGGALSVTTAALRYGDTPLPQRVSLESEAAAYSALLGKRETAVDLRVAVRSLAEAAPSDALDAAALGTARELIALLDASVDRRAPNLPFASDAERAYGNLIARRADPALALFKRAFTVANSAVAAAPAPIKAGTEPPGSQLTKRECEILELLAQGLTNKEIAQRFVVSPRTVETHVERVLSKLGVGTRTRAVAVALRRGLVSTP